MSNTGLLLILKERQNMNKKNSRSDLISIIDTKIFNMKTICELSGIPYQTFRDSKVKDFETMSDDRIDQLLKTIYLIGKYL